MQASPTPHADINELLELLLSEMQSILGKKLIGLYIFGSLVVGDFDYENSDIDLVAALSADLDEKEFERLRLMHQDVVNHIKKWDNRIEIGYIAVENLKKAPSPHTIALISPGEPFHVKETETDWIINRSVLHEKGLALYGPPSKVIVAPISREELMQTVHDNAKNWREWITHTEIIRHRRYQAYIILTMCRELYRLNHDGKVVSKKEAVFWAEKKLPEWSSLIQDALIWRDAWRDEQVDHDATLSETLRFVRFVISQCENESGVAQKE